MRYAYYKSCSLYAMGKEYDSTVRYIFKKLGDELVDVKDWVCCGSTLAHHSSKLLSIALPIKNIAQVEKQGFTEVIVPCNACYQRFKWALYELEKHPELKSEIEEIIGQPYSGNVKVYHPLEVLSKEEILEKLPGLVVKKLPALKVACYYGCLLVRPPKITRFEDDSENPTNMETILKAVGIATVDWSFKTECCGGSMSTTRPDIVKKLSKRVFDDAKAAGANAIADPCIFCHMNLDTREQEIEKENGIKYDLPVFYFTQLVAYALGATNKELMLDRHFVEADKVLQGVD